MPGKSTNPPVKLYIIFLFPHTPWISLLSLPAGFVLHSTRGFTLGCFSSFWVDCFAFLMLLLALPVLGTRGSEGELNSHLPKSSYKTWGEWAFISLVLNSLSSDPQPWRGSVCVQESRKSGTHLRTCYAGLLVAIALPQWFINLFDWQDW